MSKYRDPWAFAANSIKVQGSNQSPATYTEEMRGPTTTRKGPTVGKPANEARNKYYKSTTGRRTRKS